MQEASDAACGCMELDCVATRRNSQPREIYGAEGCARGSVKRSSMLNHLGMGHGHLQLRDGDNEANARPAGNRLSLSSILTHRPSAMQPKAATQRSAPCGPHAMAVASLVTSVLALAAAITEPEFTAERRRGQKQLEAVKSQRVRLGLVPVSNAWVNSTQWKLEAAGLAPSTWDDGMPGGGTQSSTGLGYNGSSLGGRTPLQTPLRQGAPLASRFAPCVAFAEQMGLLEAFEAAQSSQLDAASQVVFACAHAWCMWPAHTRGTLMRPPRWS